MIKELRAAGKETREMTAIKNECKMAHEKLTKRVEEVTQTMGTKEREMETQIETTKVTLEGEIQGAHRELTMVKEEVDEVKIEIIEIKAKQVETGGRVKEEIIECMNMLYLQRDKVLKDQAKRIQVLDTKREEVSTVKVNHGETEHVHDAIVCVSSFGGIKDPGFLGVPNVPSV